MIKNKIVKANTLVIKESILSQCEKKNDKWSTEIKSHLQNCNDLVAADAIYHKSCHCRLYFEIKSDKSRGRPVDDTMNETFLKLCLWLEQESEVELFTLEDLQKKMETFSNGNSVYTAKRLKQKLHDRYKEHIVFSEYKGRKNVVCFKRLAV
jgi:FMN phosphatase YigB (HAD superfamily)